MCVRVHGCVKVCVCIWGGGGFFVQGGPPSPGWIATSKRQLRQLVTCVFCQCVWYELKRLSEVLNAHRVYASAADSSVIYPIHPYCQLRKSCLINSPDGQFCNFIAHFANLIPLRATYVILLGNAQGTEKYFQRSIRIGDRSEKVIF